MSIQISNWIKNVIKQEENNDRNPWDYLDPFNENDLDNLIRTAFFDPITWPEYQEIKNEIKEVWYTSKQAHIINTGVDGNIYYSDNINSNWESYKKKLENDDWRKDDIANLEKSVFNILRKLKKETERGKPIKGLVVGQVQSGKTANFAGLMALAADNTWNMFIILSGVIENLRSQTQQRILDDLTANQHTNWCSLPKNPNFSDAAEPYRPISLDLGPNSNKKYFTVCLKNSTRLKNLRDWLWYEPNTARNMRIILIDDEADQAGINTLLKNNRNEVTAINRLIREIVHGGELDEAEKTYKPPKLRGEREHNEIIKYKAMNYIGYTATPYANILNETGEHTLYPKDFIATLEPSPLYFGTSRLFGGPEEEAIDVIREVPAENGNNELNEITDIHNSPGNIEIQLPGTLKKAICWYICCAAVFRCKGRKDPTSMLIHTSQRTFHHTNIRVAVEKWLENSQDEVKQTCKTVWEEETNKLPLKDFIKQCNEVQDTQDYPLEINDYPRYDDIEPYINTLLSIIGYIGLKEKGEIEYHKGIHICEDNCMANYDAEDGFYMRLIYPDKEKSKQLKESPSFIVIGGNTLSRGLTLKGLVSSYFLRTSTTAIDTLTQMGRWFGFRRGYELYPRIWMTQTTKNNFKKIAKSETSLRDEIKLYSIKKKFPIDYSPRILTHPDSRLNPTAKGRMFGNRPVNIEFSGEILQTTLFENDTEKLKRNKKTTEEFVLQLAGNNKAIEKGKNLLWRDISWDIIKQLFEKYEFNKDARRFSEIDLLIEWLEKCNNKKLFGNWNVALCGPGRGERWEINEQIYVNKRNFSAQRIPEDGYNYFSFKRIREHKDLLIDTDEYENIGSIKYEVDEIFKRRNNNALQRTPLLLINCVNKKYENVNVGEDFIGFSILFPMIEGGEGNYIAARIKGDEEIEKYDIDDGGEDND